MIQENNKPEVNKINSLDMATWKFVMQAHIKAKGWMDALDSPRPKKVRAILNATLRKVREKKLLNAI
jgi:hypothetical protein